MNNYQKYCDEQTDQLLNDAPTEMDEDARKDLYDQAAKRIVDADSYIYLYNPEVVQAWSSDVSGYTPRSDRAIDFSTVTIGVGARRFVLRRVGEAAIVLVGVSVLVFSIIHLVPGDLVRLALGTRFDQDTYDALRERAGLDEPLVQQYLEWAGDALRMATSGSARARRSPA